MVRQGNADIAFWLQVAVRRRNLRQVREGLNQRGQMQLRYRNFGDQDYEGFGKSRKSFFPPQTSHFSIPLLLGFLLLSLPSSFLGALVWRVRGNGRDPQCQDSQEGTYRSSHMETWILYHSLDAWAEYLCPSRNSDGEPSHGISALIRTDTRELAWPLFSPAQEDKIRRWTSANQEAGPQ